ncbi:hypothetical protein SAMN02799630_03973 [Paenibacillus sp. UNCCL117]|uniref:hypothetical protein n=1 Tax=unclassified Paenibacillus TaxID=185978 RepID=UPI000883DE71|nr:MULTISPECIES: hypothetical protein [unclassified Paenibacillus]SDD76523.1 hypothetical protein SAMN04488602_11339 [Paenibacillus sp. cl123]SFW52463.1 hypothetical protein SAMN02799630_03973 [Paenibacillus sp. UNCCL117]
MNENSVSRNSPLEALFWCIAFPGFGQLLNRHYIKGIVLIAMEIVINMGSHLNSLIVHSFLGDIQTAVEHTNYQWLMFYPCVYMFGIWDAFKHAGGGQSPNAAFPFIFCAFFATIGVALSSRLKIAGLLLGPVWLPMLFALAGVFVGFLIKRFLNSLPSHSV